MPEVTTRLGERELAAVRGLEDVVVGHDGGRLKLEHEVLASGCMCDPAVVADLTAAGTSGASRVSWSPRGGQIAVSGNVAGSVLNYSGGDLYVVKPDATGLREVLAGGAEPSWAPDGERVAVVHQNHLTIVDVATGARRTFDGRARVGDTAPAWSPDGRRIAFLRGLPYTEDLWVLDVATHRARRLTHGSSSDVGPRTFAPLLVWRP